MQKTDEPVRAPGVVQLDFPFWIFSLDQAGPILAATPEEDPVSQRFSVADASPQCMKAMLGLAASVRATGLEPALLELVKIRISQINGCAFCLAMHLPDARRLGETEARLDLVAAWREAPLFTPRERAALGWAEAVARLERGEVPDADYQEARRHFSEAETAHLAFAAVEISGWNRLMLASRTPPQAAKA